MSALPTKSVDRSEIFWELTRSICPICTRVIDAQVLFRDNRVILRKRCPEHGWFEAVTFSDAELYVASARHNKPGTLPLEFATEVVEGCPHDCGLCPEHKQHACLGLIEVNTACNLACPLCFADADQPGSGHSPLSYELTYGQVDYMLDRFVAAEGNPEVVQFSGGEPTIHPRILDFIELAQSKRIRYVMLNTNGVRMARDERFFARLAELKPYIYLQFDGFEERTNEIIRGKKDLLADKLRALDRMARAGMRGVLVMALEHGVNEHEVGDVIRFGVEHPAVFGVTIQPAFHSGRFMSFDPMQRMTIPDVLGLIEAQAGEHFVRSDFVPIPCCFPTCNFVTYAYVDHGHVTPLPRVLDVEPYLDYLANRTLPDLSPEVQRALEALWSSSAVPGTDRAAGHFHCAACNLGMGLPPDVRDLADRLFVVAIKDFLDRWTFNVKTLMKCCVEVLVPDGRMIPFCAYNSVGYREQIRAALATHPGAVGPGSLGPLRLPQEA